MRKSSRLPNPNASFHNQETHAPKQTKSIPENTAQPFQVVVRTISGPAQQVLILLKNEVRAKRQHTPNEYCRHDAGTHPVRRRDIPHDLGLLVIRHTTVDVAL